MSTMSRNHKPLFANLPQELYRCIYDYDDTYHGVFKSVGFNDDLILYLYKRQLKLTYYLIDKLNQFRRDYFKINNESYDGKNIQYNIIMRTHEKNTNIIQFNLIPVDQDTDGDCLYGYICTQQDTHSIYPELLEMCVERSDSSSSALLLYYNAMENDQYLLV